MKFYAQLDDKNICTGVSQLAGEVTAAGMIEIPDASSEYLWKKYTNGEWSEESYAPQPEPTEPVPTNTEINNNQIIIMDALATLYEAMLAKGGV